MTDLSDLLRHDAVVAGVAVPSKKAVIAAVAATAAGLVDGDPRDIAERLAAREKLGSTGFGLGVAIPHARLPGLATVIGVFLRLAQPVDFAAVDDLPVDLVFALLSPVEAGAEHLKALARVSRRMRDRALLAKLRGAGSRDALYALLCQDEARDAA